MPAYVTKIVKSSGESRGNCDCHYQEHRLQCSATARVEFHCNTRQSTYYEENGAKKNQSELNGVYCLFVGIIQALSLDIC
jgi:hypothetical protein